MINQKIPDKAPDKSKFELVKVSQVTLSSLTIQPSYRLLGYNNIVVINSKINNDEIHRK